MDTRFARAALEGFRIPFGHKHVGQEEVYVVVRGSGRIKFEDEVVEVAEWDAVRFDKETMRNVEAGPAGISTSRSVPGKIRSRPSSLPAGGAKGTTDVPPREFLELALSLPRPFLQRAARCSTVPRVGQSPTDS